MRRLASVVIGGWLVLTWLFSAEPVGAQFHTCSFENTSPGGFSGNRQDNGTTGSVYGVKAVINTTLSTFRPCAYTAGVNSTSAWIGIVPAAGTANSTNPSAIYQVGIVNCSDTPTYPDLCSNLPAGRLAWFWAYGGCNGVGPRGRLLAYTDDNQHTYEIHHFSSPQSGYSIYIDGAYYAATTKYASDPALSCWLGSRHGAIYMTETWDAGDGIADQSPASPVISSSVGWRITDGGPWQSPTWSGTSSCLRHTTTSFLDLQCDISNADNTQFYTWSTLN